MARANPWYGYKRIAVMCRREAQRDLRQPKVTNRQCYRVMKAHDLLQKPVAREAELYQTAKLWQLLPQGPNELWQTDVTYVHTAACRKRKNRDEDLIRAIRFERACVYEDLGRKTQARREFEKLYAEDPADQAVAHRLGL